MTTKWEVSQLYLGHFGVILSNLSILSFVLLAGAGLSSLFYILYLLVLGLIAISTLGLIFLANPRFGDLFSNLDSSIEFFKSVAAAIPYLSILTIALTSVSIICLLLDSRKHISRLIAASIMLLLSILSVSGIFIGVGV